MTIALITAGKVCAMALNLTSRLQVTAHYFWYPLATPRHCSITGCA